MENIIRVTAADNQLILIAYQSGDASGNEIAYDICNIQSGYNASVNAEIHLVPGDYRQVYPIYNGSGDPIESVTTVTLPSGDYKLVGIGISWGLAKAFAYSLNTNALGTPYTDGDFNGIQATFDPLGFTIPPFPPA